MRTPVDVATTARAFDPTAYVRVNDVVAAWTASPAWEVEAHELSVRRAPRRATMCTTSCCGHGVALEAAVQPGPAVAATLRAHG